MQVQFSLWKNLAVRNTVSEKSCQCSQGLFDHSNNNSLPFPPKNKEHLEKSEFKKIDLLTDLFSPPRNQGHEQDQMSLDHSVSLNAKPCLGAPSPSCSTWSFRSVEHWLM